MAYDTQSLAKTIATTWKKLRDKKVKDRAKQIELANKHEQEMTEILNVSAEPDPMAIEKARAKHMRRLVEAQRKVNEQKIEDQMRLESDKIINKLKAEQKQEQLEQKLEQKRVQQEQQLEIKAEQQQKQIELKREQQLVATLHESETRIQQEQERVKDDKIKELKEQDKQEWDEAVAKAHPKPEKPAEKSAFDVPRTGPAAIAAALAAIDLDKMEQEARDIIRGGPKTKRPQATARLAYINGLKRTGVNPADLMVTKTPVLPPNYRPYILGDTLIPGDINMLYKDLMEVRDAHAQERTLFGEEASGMSRLALYDAMKAAYGYGDPVNPKLREKQVSGMMSQLLGSSPKYSVIQHKLLSKTQDNVGRSTIVPDPELGLDQIGIPEDIAWDMYGSYVQRRLVQAGEKPSMAIQMVKNRDTKAFKELQAEMRVRPVVYSRAPAWHKFSSLGAYPVLRKDNAIGVTPMVETGLNADHDGDSGRFCITIQISVDLVRQSVQDQAPMKFNNLHILQYQGPGPGMKLRIEDLPHAADPTKQDDKGRATYAVPAGVYALSYNLDTGLQAWMPVTEFSVHPDIDLHTVTVGGETFLASNDHSLLAFSRQTNRVEKMRPLDTRTGNKANLMAPVSASKNQRNNYIKTVAIEGFGQVELTEDLGFAIGVYMGDGCFSVDRTTSAERNYVKAMYLYGGGAPSSRRKQKTHMAAMQTFSRVFNLTGRIDYDEHVRESLGGKIGLSGRTFLYHGDNTNLEHLHNWVKQAIGATADTKRFPAFFSQACEDFRWGLFLGVMASDGTVSLSTGKKNPQLQVALNSITSSDFAADFVSLCASLGLRANITKATRATMLGKEELMIPVSTISLARRYQDSPFTFHCPERDAILSEYLPKIRLENVMDRVPFPGGELGAQLKLASWKKAGKPMNGTKKDCGKATVWAASGMWNRAVAARELQELAEYLAPELIPELEAFSKIALDTNVVWEEILVSDETVRMTAYDLTVPGPYTFATAGGVFVQDTINLHVPHSSAVIKEIQDKLMGSRQLRSIRDPDKVMPDLKQEQILGLHTAKHSPSGIVHTFPDRDSALSSILSGKVRLNDAIEIGQTPAPQPML